MVVRYFSPSYKRGKTAITQNTYSCFDYIISEAEKEDYKDKKCVLIPKEVQGNISRVRNYILDLYPKDAIVMMDDDCEGIYRWDNCLSKKLSLDEFESFCENMVQMILDCNLMYGGVNIAAPGDKGAYREYTPFSFISPVLGPFCIHVANQFRYDKSIPLKEDYDMSLQQLKHNRGILRANAYSYKVKQASNLGGCSTSRNSKSEKDQFDKLQKKWGSKIVKYDKQSKKSFDFNPIIKTPLKGV
tara:strand:- start:331 stop:1062 length:732 start_codon:yes stop_codon:yes gene_type:complete